MSPSGYVSMGRKDAEAPAEEKDVNIDMKDSSYQDSCHEVHVNVGQPPLSGRTKSDVALIRKDSAIPHIEVFEYGTKAPIFRKPTSLRGVAELVTQLPRISSSELVPIEVIGKGSYAVVYKCLQKLGDGSTTTVAVKRPRSKTALNLDNMTFFVEEGVLMSLIDHPSIVKVHGFGCQSGAVSAVERLTGTFMMEEYLPGGTLLDLLEKSTRQRRADYTIDDAFRWMILAAEALHYLHALSPKIIHRDIKPDNILLTDPCPAKSAAKITDFGLHRAICTDTATPSSILNYWQVAQTDSKPVSGVNPSGEVYKMTGGTGSVMYMAPEVMQKILYNEKVDVFAFGVVLYETLSGILLRNLYISDQNSSNSYRKYATRVNSGWRPPLPVEWPEELQGLVSSCWAQNPSDRPCMLDVIQCLQAIQLSLHHASVNWSSRLQNSHREQAAWNASCSRVLETLCCLR